MNFQELAVKAVDELDQRGWIQGTYGNSGSLRQHPFNLPEAEAERVCKVCMLGAINAAEFGVPWPATFYSPEVKRLHQALYARLFGDGPISDAEDEISIWNDKPGRTFQEVRGVLLAVARSSDAST